MIYHHMVTLVLLRIILVVLLVAANAFFVAAEFAMVSVRDTRIQQLIEQRRIGARTVRKIQQHLDEFLPAVQFGVTLASLGLGWVGEGTLAAVIAPWLGSIPYARVYAHGLSATLAFLAITYSLIILGELVPKSLALERAERVALAVAGSMDVFMTISHPFLMLMNRSANLVLRGFGSRLRRDGGAHTPDELKLIVTASRRLGLLPEAEEEMIHKALELGNVTVREIMVPRHKIFSLPADMPLDEAMATVASEAGTSFDPKVVAILKRRYIELEKMANEQPLQAPPKLSTDSKVQRGAAPDAGFAESAEKGLSTSPIADRMRTRCAGFARRTRRSTS